MQIIKFFIIVCSLLPMSVLANNLTCKNNPLYCKILKFNPKIDKTFAMDLSNKIAKKSKLNGIDPNISLAILIQETGLNNVHTFKTHTTVDRYCEEGKCFKVVKEVSEVFDMTIAQINIKTADHYGFDIERLFNKDLDYALDCHYVILRDKMKLCSKEENSWACYHSMKEPYKSLYIELVSRYL